MELVGIAQKNIWLQGQLAMTPWDLIHRAVLQDVFEEWVEETLLNVQEGKPIRHPPPRTSEEYEALIMEHRHAA